MIIISTIYIYYGCVLDLFLYSKLLLTFQEGLTSEKAYLHAKVPWIGCGEHRAKDCQCKGTVQLHVIQELVKLSRKYDKYV
jgi:hypothetical protein